MIRTLTNHLYDRTGAFKLAFIYSPLFYGGLIIKLYAAAFLAGQNFSTLFTPFVKAHLLISEASAYENFFSLGVLEVFPYPALMLYLLAIPGYLFYPFLTADVFSLTHFERFIFHIPILIADIVILTVLSRWLKDKQTILLWIYWLSPVLIYINYIHSQLDVIPIAFVFVFLYFLFKEHWWYAFIFLGAAVATKFHIIILLPFTLIYLWRKRVPLHIILLCGSTVAGVFVLLNHFYLTNTAFLTIVFANREQAKVFDLFLSFGEQGLVYIIPVAYTLLILHAITFARINRDTFVMFLGFAFGILTLFIPPMPGWYYWILPFFIYFYVKNPQFSKLPFYSLIISYIFYFALTPDSDYFYVWHAIFPGVASLPNLYTLIDTYNFDASLIRNVALSILQATLLINVLWIYRRGVEESKKSKLYNMPYLIGVAGDSGSGKSTLAILLTNLFGDKHVSVVPGDALHKWERGNEMWQKYTHLDPRANQLHQDIAFARALQSGEDVYRRQYDHHTGTFTKEQRLQSKTLVLFEGLHSFFLDDMRQALDLKIFIKPDEQLRTHWKVFRDIKDRGYTKERSLAQLKTREVDSKEYITTQEKHADITFAMKVLETIPENKLGTDFKPLVYLEVQCNNTVNLEPLLRILEPYVNTEHTITDKHQIVSFAGSISGAIIEHLSYDLIPEFSDISVTEPQFMHDHNGLMQLFLTYYIFESLHYNRHHSERTPPRATALTEIAIAAEELGSNVHYVQGGGGNVSIKLSDNLMAVKASGFRLDELRDNAGFVGANFVTLRRFFNTPRTTENQSKLFSEYDSVVKDSRLSLPNLPDTSLRPSIETGFHAVLGTAVIHTHSTYVNIFTCSKEGEKELEKLFPDSCYIPYRTPGTPLTVEVSSAFKARPVDTFFLKNHGLIVSGQSVKDALKRHYRVNEVLQQHLTLPEALPPFSIRTETRGFSSTDSLLGNYLKTRLEVLHKFQDTILFPDQVVYSQKFGFSQTNQPITLHEKSGTLTYHTSYKEAQAFIETLLSWLFIYEGIQKNGFTIDPLPKTEGETIANLDSEKYRQRLIS